MYGRQNKSCVKLVYYKFSVAIVTMTVIIMCFCFSSHLSMNTLHAYVDIDIIETILPFEITIVISKGSIVAIMSTDKELMSLRLKFLRSKF